jgi:hypothetical protein
MSLQPIHKNIDAISLFGTTLSRLMENQSDFAFFLMSQVQPVKIEQTI